MEQNKPLELEKHDFEDPGSAKLAKRTISGVCEPKALEQKKDRWFFKLLVRKNC